GSTNRILRIRHSLQSPTGICPHAFRDAAPEPQRRWRWLCRRGRGSAPHRAGRCPGSPGLMGGGMGRLLRRSLLLGPALFIIGFFMLLPLFLMGYVSILERGMAGGVQWGQHTVEAYVRFLFARDLMANLVVNIDYLRIFARSFLLALSTTIIALLIGLPTAFYMSLQPARWRNLLIFLVTIPFWTNLLVRNYAWILLLRDSGLINGGLQWLGLSSEPIRLLYTPF